MLTNYNEGIRKLESVAHDWKHKYLTISGKITVVKTFMLSVLSHVATVLPTPNSAYCKKSKKSCQTSLEVRESNLNQTRI